MMTTRLKDGWVTSEVTAIKPVKDPFRIKAYNALMLTIYTTDVLFGIVRHKEIGMNTVFLPHCHPTLYFAPYYRERLGAPTAMRSSDVNACAKSDGA